MAQLVLTIAVVLSLVTIAVGAALGALFVTMQLVWVIVELYQIIHK